MISKKCTAIPCSTGKDDPGHCRSPDSSVQGIVHSRLFHIQQMFTFEGTSQAVQHWASTNCSNNPADQIHILEKKFYP